MLKRFKAWIQSLFVEPQWKQPALLVICRKYQDANGHYIGELYAQQGTQFGVRGLVMIGVSLDSLALECRTALAECLDTRNDFLTLMPSGVVRVGSADPAKNAWVQEVVGRMPKAQTKIIIQNRFIEAVLEKKTC